MTRRIPAVLAAVVMAAVAFTPAAADARAGGRSSFGSRGTRTYSAPPVTNTAPFTAAPVERSLTARPAPAPLPGTSGFASVPRRRGFGSGLAGGLVGGLLGVGLGGLLMGHGFFGGGLGGFGILGLLLQLALLFFVARWLLGLFRRRQLAFAGMARMGQPATSAPRPSPGGSANGPAVNIGQQDFQAFERLLQGVQAAWSAHDIHGLGQLATPEMTGYFNEQLTEQASRGVRNSVTDVKLEQGDLAEAWSEAGREYATVAMRFSMLDVTRDAGGRIVEGDAALRTMATELWTFVRAPGGRWLLSAIQQTR